VLSAPIPEEEFLDYQADGPFTLVFAVQGKVFVQDRDCLIGWLA